MKPFDPMHEYNTRRWWGLLFIAAAVIGWGQPADSLRHPSVFFRGGSSTTMPPPYETARTDFRTHVATLLADCRSDLRERIRSLEDQVKSSVVEAEEETTQNLGPTITGSPSFEQPEGDEGSIDETSDPQTFKASLESTVEGESPDPSFVDSVSSLMTGPQPTRGYDEELPATDQVETLQVEQFEIESVVPLHTIHERDDETHESTHNSIIDKTANIAGTSSNEEEPSYSPVEIGNGTIERMDESTIPEQSNQDIPVTNIPDAISFSQDTDDASTPAIDQIGEEFYDTQESPLLGMFGEQTRVQPTAIGNMSATSTVEERETVSLSPRKLADVTTTHIVESVPFEMEVTVLETAEHGEKFHDAQQQHSLPSIPSLNVEGELTVETSVLSSTDTNAGMADDEIFHDASEVPLNTDMAYDENFHDAAELLSNSDTVGEDNNTFHDTSEALSSTDTTNDETFHDASETLSSLANESASSLEPISNVDIEAPVPESDFYDAKEYVAGISEDDGKAEQFIPVLRATEADNGELVGDSFGHTSPETQGVDQFYDAQETEIPCDTNPTSTEEEMVGKHRELHWNQDVLPHTTTDPESESAAIETDQFYDAKESFLFQHATVDVSQTNITAADLYTNSEVDFVVGDTDEEDATVLDRLSSHQVRSAPVQRMSLSKKKRSSKLTRKRSAKRPPQDEPQSDLCVKIRRKPKRRKKRVQEAAIEKEQMSELSKKSTKPKKNTSRTTSSRKHKKDIAKPEKASSRTTSRHKETGNSAELPSEATTRTATAASLLMKEDDKEKRTKADRSTRETLAVSSVQTGVDAPKKRKRKRKKKGILKSRALDSTIGTRAVLRAHEKKKVRFQEDEEDSSSPALAHKQEEATSIAKVGNLTMNLAFYFLGAKIVVNLLRKR